MCIKNKNKKLINFCAVIPVAQKCVQGSLPLGRRKEYINIYYALIFKPDECHEMSGLVKIIVKESLFFFLSQ